MFFWAISYIWIKIIYNYYSPITTVFLRLSIAALILCVLDFFIKKSEKVEKKDLKAFMLMAFFEPFCYFIGESFGLKFVSPTVTSIMVSTIPVVTPFFALFILKEKISPMNVAGLFISFAGLFILVTNGSFSLEASPIGLLLLSFAVVSAVGYSIMVKKLSHKYSNFTIIKEQNRYAAIYFLPLFLFFDLNSFFGVEPTFELVSSVLKLAIFPSIIAFFLFIHVIREIGASKANVFANLIPIFTAFLSYFLLGEVFTPRKVVGMTIVIAGLFLSQLKFGTFLKLRIRRK